VFYPLAAIATCGRQGPGTEPDLNLLMPWGYGQKRAGQVAEDSVLASFTQQSQACPERAGESRTGDKQDAH
jgi:hypothetical protein